MKKQAWNKGLKGEDYLKHFGGKHPMKGKKVPYKPRLKARGRIPWNKGKKLPYVTKRNLENNPMKNPKVVEKYTNTHWSKSSRRDEIIKKMSETKKKNYALGIIDKSNMGIKSKLEETKQKRRDTMKKNGTIQKLGKNGRWLGGKSFEPYGLAFNDKLKRNIRKRDNQICMLCGVHREKVKRAFDIHHINYDKRCNIPQNLISLCISCHSLTQVNREHWTKFFQALLEKRYNYKYSDDNKVILEFKNEN